MAKINKLQKVASAQLAGAMRSWRRKETRAHAEEAAIRIVEALRAGGDTTLA